jgi:hypothetical protein
MQCNKLSLEIYAIGYTWNAKRTHSTMINANKDHAYMQTTTTFRNYILRPSMHHRQIRIETFCYSKRSLDDTAYNIAILISFKENRTYGNHSI